MVMVLSQAIYLFDINLAITNTKMGSRCDVRNTFRQTNPEETLCRRLGEHPD